MIPNFHPSGNLPPGIHEASWQEVAQRFGTNPIRNSLLDGMLQAFRNLRKAGCARVYLGGSFITAKECPGDFDVAWETAGIDEDLLHPSLRRLSSRLWRKQAFGGDISRAESIADGRGHTFVEFYQTDHDARVKGILAISLETVPQ